MVKLQNFRWISNNSDKRITKWIDKFIFFYFITQIRNNYID
jgi:hypothetical protein